MEEHIISYEKNEEIEKIISEFAKKEFLLVKHSTDKKQLHFKKFAVQPETLIISEP